MVDTSRQSEETTLPASRISTADKPLPSPPIAQVTSSELRESPRSLIDASEKPLRRNSPSKTQSPGEEWPVLFPTKPTAPATLRMVAASGEAADTVDYSPSTEERYPSLVQADVTLLANPKAVEVQQSSERKSGTANKETRRKPVQSVGSSILNSSLQAKEDATKLDSTTDKKADMSASAAALEKFEGNVSRNFSLPSPDGTASLRARLLSAAEIRDPVEVSREHSEKSWKPDARTSPPEIVNYDDPSYGKSSAEYNQAQNFRPSSRNSGRGRFPIVTQQSRVISNTRITSVTKAKGEKSAELVAVKEPVSKNTARRSSIPVLANKKTRLSQDVFDSEADSPCQAASSKIKAKSVGDASALFQDTPAYDADDEANKRKAASRDEYKTIARQNPFEEDLGRSKTVQILGAAHVRTLSDVPEDSLSVRPLSKTHPEHGATLTISDQASSVIYGGKEVKEESKASAIKESGVGLHRTIVTNELLKGNEPNKPLITTKKLRPLSVYELESSGPSGTSSIKPTPISKGSIVSHPAIRDDDDPFVDNTNSQAHPDTSATTKNPFVEKQPAKEVDTRDYVVRSKVDPNVSMSKSPSTLIGRISLTGRTSPLPDHDGLRRLRAAQKSLQQAQRGSIQSLNPYQGHRQTAGFARPTSSSENRARSPIVQAKTESPKFKRPVTPSGLNHVYPHPPRSSSLTPVEGISGRTAENPKASKQTTLGQTKEYTVTQIKPGESTGEPTQTALGDARGKRASHASGKSMLSMKNLRGLFHKNEAEKKPVKGKREAVEKARIPTTASLQPGNTTTNEAGRRSSRSTSPIPAGLMQSLNQSNHEHEIAETTSLATQILNSARDERSNSKKERLLQMGKVMVDAITSARDAEVAMEQAKIAAEKAEMSYMLTRRSVMDVSRMVKEWKKIMEGGKL